MLDRTALTVPGGPMQLHDYLARSARRHASAIAVQEAAGATCTYRKLADLSRRLRDTLIHLGVEPGDRVGVYLRKSIDTVAVIFSILEAGAAYVPVDPTAPAARNACILNDCSVKLIIVERSFKAALERELGSLGLTARLLVLEQLGGGTGLDALAVHNPLPPAATRPVAPSELAYILYTSGSTGKPKGVMLSHENASCFIEWCLKTFEPTSSDRMSSHAPFHFDLSILDIFVPLACGARVVLIAEDGGKEPLALAQTIAEARITIWYSAPSILSMLAQFGRLGLHDYSALRHVLFAGEVFPVAHLRSLCEQWPGPRYFNLYGPTETNVCTFYEVQIPIPKERTHPYPIGKPCSHAQALVVGSNGEEVPAGMEGELCIAGPSVLAGYWNLPEQTARAFLHSARRFYRTGDVVVQEGDGNLRFIGRRDRMVKKRGFRVELGEIESCLYTHPKVKEAAVVAISDDATGVRIHAHLSLDTVYRRSLIEMKSFCAARLPLYMVPDTFRFHGTLPKTSTDKIDYQRLQADV